MAGKQHHRIKTTSHLLLQVTISNGHAPLDFCNLMHSAAAAGLGTHCHTRSCQVCNFLMMYQYRSWELLQLLKKTDFLEKKALPLILLYMVSWIIGVAWVAPPIIQENTAAATSAIMANIDGYMDLIVSWPSQQSAEWPKRWVYCGLMVLLQCITYRIQNCCLVGYQHGCKTEVTKIIFHSLIWCDMA